MNIFGIFRNILEYARNLKEDSVVGSKRNFPFNYPERQNQIYYLFIDISRFHCAFISTFNVINILTEKRISF